MDRFILVLIFFIFFEQLCAQNYFPSNNSNQWDTISPKSMGWCEDRIDSLYKMLEDNDTKAFIVLKDGKIVLEKYFKSFTRDSNWYWASAGKTLTGVCVGIANQEGLLQLSDKSSKYLGVGWTSMSIPQEDKVTIRHQLTMTTGLDEAGVYFDCTSPSCLKYKSDAGTRWAYHNSPYTLLDSVIESSTGMSLNSFVDLKIKSIIGMNGLYIKSGFNNVYYSTPRSAARFGLLMLHKGNWNGTQILKDSHYFNSMTNSSQALNLAYGYLTWLNGKSSYILPNTQTIFQGSLFPDAPWDMYAALGKNGQFINVVPSQNLVLIRMGNIPNSTNVPADFNNEIWKQMNLLKCTVVSSIKDSQLKIQLYPNPTSNIIYVTNYRKGLYYRVDDLLGRTLLSGELTEANIMLENNIASGSYLISIFDTKMNSILKLRITKED